MTTTYDPGLVLAQFGVITLSGFAEGEMIEVEFLGEGTGVAVGTGGEAAYVENHNRSAKIKARLMATSPINIALSAHYLASNLPAPFVITSLSTLEVLAAGDAKITKMPNSSFGAEVPVREWEWVCAQLEAI